MISFSEFYKKYCGVKSPDGSIDKLPPMPKWEEEIQDAFFEAVDEAHRTGKRLIISKKRGRLQ